ncbi:interleukin-6 receptor subunit alpha [Xiphias gladius]|uniref:interleukin-6 receptor subunit alpha n=1 Tax=Xiphias gladius TaxID=8245 RepID=UPI001A98E407|nr:interleukin-6 receptor subunit alpha [Xiphias gladius]
MRIFLPLLSVLCVTQVHGIFSGTCPRKHPPPGVLVLSPGSKLVLNCKGHVMVDGVKVKLSGHSSNTSRRGSSLLAPTTTGNIINKKRAMDSTVNEGHHFNPEAAVSTVTGENRSPRNTDTAYTVSPTTHGVQPPSVGRLLKGESHWEAGEVVEGGDYEEDEEDEGEEGSRVTRLQSRPQWKWNGRTVGNIDRDLREITFERSEATLSLFSVSVTDSGKYTCHHRGRERFSLKVIVADPPEDPSLSCYKKSPSSKIRCEWAPQRPFTRQQNCYLILNKRPTETFRHVQCSYSSRLSRYWCALDHNEDEMRTLHMAYLCVTSIAGNATSTLLPFTPLGILKPDPPSDVKVKQEEGHETWIKVTWNFPTSWKPQDRYYELIYEVKYRPLKSSFYHEQIEMIKGLGRSHTITDAMPGVQYLIQLRAKEEYDGQWSDWSTPVNARSWTAPSLSDDLITTMFPISTEEGSGTDDYMPEADPEAGDSGVKVSHHVLWIPGSFFFLSVILAAYIFRHRDRFMSKLHRVSVIIHSGDSSQIPPTISAAPEGQALVTFTSPRYKDPPPSEAEEEEEGNEEEPRVKERIEAVHFNNTSYFLVQRE